MALGKSSVFIDEETLIKAIQSMHFSSEAIDILAKD
jgi:hypothetical protein